MPEPQYSLTIVDSAEFNMLELLPDYERRGGDLVRLEGDAMYATMLQSEYDRMQRLVLEVEAECSNVSETLLEQPVAAEISAPPVPPKTPDQLVWERIMPDTIPERPNNRPRESFGFDPFGGR